jgi:V/A-type H+-transporting ATPase subunit I
LLAGGIYLDVDILMAIAVGLAVVASVLAFLGLLATAGGGAAGAVQAVVELFDLIIRVGSNLVSFARLAAFGLTHAALSAVVWEGTTAVWGPGLSAIAAVVLFLAGNAVALTLEALVAGIQALRLEYYELFSRVFDTEGRPFRPWVLPARGTQSNTPQQEVTG